MPNWGTNGTKEVFNGPKQMGTLPNAIPHCPLQASNTPFGNRSMQKNLC